jgi:hypothetical protein
MPPIVVSLNPRALRVTLSVTVRDWRYLLARHDKLSQSLSILQPRVGREHKIDYNRGVLPRPKGPTQCDACVPSYSAPISRLPQRS